jgi:hypothetical protein
MKNNLVGKRFGKLVVVEPILTSTRGRWLCLCDCGNTKEAETWNLKNSKVVSCGCRSKEAAIERSLLGNESPGWQGTKDIPRRVYSACKTNAEKRGIPFNLTIEDIQEVFENQKGLCRYTQLPITFEQPRITGTNRRYKSNASIDRIDSNKSYTKDNIQLVEKRVNMMKWKLTEEEFLDLAKMINENFTV